MKYSEFLQFRELLEQNGVTLEEFKKDPKLYEGILGKIGAGLWTLAKKGMAKAVSAGLQPAYKEKLNKKAEEIKNWVIKEIKKGESEPEHILYKTFAAKKKLKGAKKQDSRSIRALDNEISKFIRKNVDRQIKRIEKTFEKNKLLDEEGKENISDYWEDLGTQIEVSVGMALREAGIMSNDGFEDFTSAIWQSVHGTNKDDESKPILPKVGKEYNLFAFSMKDDKGNIVGVERVKVTKIDKIKIYYIAIDNGKAYSISIKNAKDFKLIKKP